MTQQQLTFQKAQKALAAGDSKKAEKLLKKLLRAPKLLVPVCVLLSKSLVAQGKLKEAADRLSEAAEAQPDNAALQKAAGDLYAKLRLHQNALPFFEKAVASTPDNPTLWNMLLTTMLNIYQSDRERHSPLRDDLLALSTKSLDLFPNAYDLVFAAAEICFAAGLFDPAKQYLDVCRQANHTDIRVHHRWLEIHHQEENYAPIRQFAKDYADVFKQDALCHRVIATAFEKNGQVDSAKTHIDHALALQPKNAEYLASKGRILYHLGRFDEAIPYLDQSIAFDPGLVAPRANRCLVQKKRGQVAAAAIDEPYRLRIPDDNPKFNLSVPLWDGSPLEGRRLFIWSDQGVGDVFKYALLIHDLDYEPGQLNLSAQAKMVPFLKHVFPDINIRPFPRYRTPPVPEGETRVSPVFDPIEEDFDCHIPLGFLYRHLRPTIKSFREHSSVFQLSEAVIAPYRALDILTKPNTTKVGIAWSSKNRNPLVERNYLTPEDLLPLLRMPGFAFYNFQYDVSEEEINRFSAEHDVPLYHAPGLDLFDDLLGTAAFNSCMDLFVSPASTCSDIAGSLGLKCLRADLIHMPENLGQDFVPWYRDQTSISIPYEKSIHDFFPEITAWLLAHKDHRHPLSL